MVTVFFGLFSALAWGAADFTGGLASRRSKSYQVVALVWLIGLVVNPLIALVIGEPVMPLQNWLWCAAAGVCGVVGLLILYQIFANGQMSIAVSVSAVMSAALPVLLGTFLEGIPDALKALGFLLALPAVWLITKNGENHNRLSLKVVLLPLIAGTFFGLYFILVNQGSQDYLAWPMVATRLMGCLVLGFYLLLGRRSLLPPKAAIPLILLNFTLDIAGTITYILAGQLGRMDVTAVLSSLYPGMTILLAWTILGEKIEKLQWMGILLALFSILCFSF